MSHLSKIDVSITNLKALKKAVTKLGGEFKENQKEFIYYAGNKGKCEHAASFQNCSYELGIVKKDAKTFDLEWDPYYQGNLTKVLGNKAEKLKQQYAYFCAKDAALMQGFTTTEKVEKDGTIKLVISTN